MALDYEIYDVFTDRPLSGNPLAVVYDADDLDAERMQAIAGEFNLSETIFTCRPEQPVHTARVRIFTPRSELPFAGHPTVGCAVALAQKRFAGETGTRDAVLVLEETVGPVRCAVKLDGGVAGFAEFACARLPSVSSVEAKDALAAALGLEPEEIGFENYHPSLVDAGVPFLAVPLAGLDAMERLNVDRTPLASALPDETARLSLYVYCRDSVRHDASFHARMFAEHAGIAEDPATGSAAAALAGAIHRFDELTDGHHLLTIEQGVEMGRPSLIHLSLEVEGGALSAVRIGGSAIRVAAGRLDI